MGLQILCTNGRSALDTLDHLPSLPLFVDYRDTIATITQQDKLAMRYTLLLWDRVRRIDLRLPPSVYHKLLTLMDEPFSTLEYLSLSLRLLSSNVSLVTLVLTNIRASGYFLPRPLIARLWSLPQLEELTIEFSVPIPRPSAERELSGKRLTTPVTLPNLKRLKFQGVSTYLECFISQIRAPLLERLDIALFNQIAWVLPHLSHFIDTTEAFKFPTATVLFGNEIIIIADHYINYITQQHEAPFTLCIICKDLDWQIDCAAQIYCALKTPLSGVQELELDFGGAMMPTEWQNGEIDGTTWHELLRSFTGVNKLRICAALSEEVSRALRVGEDGLDPGLLPGLQEIVTELYGKRADDLFGWFVDARRLADHPVRLMPSDTMESSEHDTMEGSASHATEGSASHAMEGSASHATEGSASHATEGSASHATEGSGYDTIESIEYDTLEGDDYNTTEADHVYTLINALQRSPHGNVARSLQWGIRIQEDPDNEAVHTATVTAILLGIPVGRGVGTSKHFAVRAAAQRALVFLEQNGILYPRG
ncbi:hypothetical protein EDB87DRAFT_1735018 [Lactarius vividus]|nr:hypothetical protein EDB87DRAFT_1735018 [Lactarius vividus]